MHHTIVQIPLQRFEVARENRPRLHGSGSVRVRVLKIWILENLLDVLGCFGLEIRRNVLKPRLFVPFDQFLSSCRSNEM